MLRGRVGEVFAAVVRGRRGRPRRQGTVVARRARPSAGRCDRRGAAPRAPGCQVRLEEADVVAPATVRFAPGPDRAGARRDQGPAPDRPAAGLRDDGLRRDERAGGGHRVGQPRPGLPRLPRARPRCSTSPAPPSAPPPTSTRPGPGCRSCATAIADARAALPRAGLRPGHRGAGHRRRHRGAGRCAARPARPRRRGRALRADVRQLRRRHRDGRRRRPPGAAAPARRPTGRHRPWTFDPAELRAAVTPAHQAAAAQHPAQPDRQGLRPRRARRWSPSSPSSTTCSCSPTRSTSTWSSPAPGTSRSPTLPGMRERTLVVSSARQDLQHHRLEDRLDLRPGRRW